MERRWPAKDVAPLVLLIDDPRHKLNEDGTYNLSEEQAQAILELRLARLTALGRDEIAEELEKIGVEIKDYLDIFGSRTRIHDRSSRMNSPLCATSSPRRAAPSLVMAVRTWKMKTSSPVKTWS